MASQEVGSRVNTCRHLAFLFVLRIQARTPVSGHLLGWLFRSTRPIHRFSDNVGSSSLRRRFTLFVNIVGGERWHRIMVDRLTFTGFPRGKHCRTTGRYSALFCTNEEFACCKGASAFLGSQSLWR